MNIAVILSGGVGTRMGTDVPKQYIKVAGKPVFWYCLKTFFQSVHVDAVVIGCALEWQEYVKAQVMSFQIEKPVYYSLPGETRQYTILNALQEIAKQGYSETDVVIIHDAARPLVTEQLIADCINGCNEADGVLPVIPVKDTLYQSKNGKQITSLLNRNELFAGQAPEAFVFGKYLALHEKMPREELLKINGSTEIAYKGGLNVKLIRGDELNFKITTPEDLSNFENILRNSQYESI